MVEVVVHSAVAVVHEGGEGGHGRRRRLFADAERGGEGGEESDPLKESSVTHH